MTRASIGDTARTLVGDGKGILAADESTPTMARRLATIDLESTPTQRRRYRELLFTTDGLADSVSGVILYDETIRQHATDGLPFPQLLASAGMVPGIKVDAGTTGLAGFPGEVVTEGLDGLRARLAEYVDLGARFAKWRGVLRIGDRSPSTACVAANAEALARYAALAQEAGLTPIVEPEVLMDGPHPVERCAEVTAYVLREVFDRLALHHVQLDGMLLKPNMVLPGSGSPTSLPDEAVAEATLAVMLDTVPASVPGIVFLSGGQTPQEATARLDALNRLGRQPWELSFSFGRALQAPVLQAWRGDMGNRDAAQDALRHRARLTALAREGRYGPELEQPAPAGARDGRGNT